MKIGLLEFCQMPRGLAGREAILEVLAGAQRADELGFSRFWLAEHHERAVAQGAPEVMATIVAAHTERIRVGCAGVLLSHACPLRTAKAFRLLQTLFPDRIDLGVAAGRAPPEVAAAFSVATPPSREAFDARVEALAAFVAGASPLQINPCPATAPELWILGSGSVISARLAGRLGASFGLSMFLSDEKVNASIIAEYCEAFRPSHWRPTPRWNIAVAGVCADSNSEAERILKNIPTASRIRSLVAGSVAHVRERLQCLAAEYRADEIIFGDMCQQLGQRLRSYELLSGV